jgi:hypothetical protein
MSVGVTKTHVSWVPKFPAHESAHGFVPRAYSPAESAAGTKSSGFLYLGELSDTFWKHESTFPAELRTNGLGGQNYLPLW